MDNFLRQIIDAFPGMVFIKDLDGVYINCSDAFAKFTGNKSPADVIGKKTFEILPKSSAQWAVHLDKLLFETHQPNSEIYPFSLENKNYSKWQRVSRRPLHDEEGNLIGLVGTLEDIGDVVALTDELAASKARFRALSETMDFNSFVVAMWDADTLELDFVSDNIRYLGLKHNRLAHMNDWANNVHPDDIDDYWDCRKPLLEQSQNVDFWHEYRILNKNGEVKWINERLSFVALPSAHLYRSVIIDTTARHEHGNIREHAQFTGEESVGGLQMLDIVSRDYLQQLCNTVTKTLGVSSFISDPSGSPITQREGLCTFCDIISSTEKGSTLCRHSHSNLCIAARENDGLVIETCDAIGLCNAVIPITVSGKLMGFWAIGRLNVTGSITEENIRALCQKLSISESEALPAFHDMPSYSFHDAKILFNELIPYVNDLSGYLYQSCLLMHEAERMIKSQEFISRSLKLDSLQNYLFDTFFSAQNTKDDNTRFHDALESIGSYFGFNRAIVLGSRAKHSEPLFQWHEQGLSALPPRLMDTQTVDCLYRFASNLHNAHHISRDDLPESWRESIFVIGHCYTYSAEFHGKCAGVVVLLQDNSRAMLDGDELESLSHVLGAFGSYLVSKQMERGAFELTDSLKLILDNLKDEVYVIDRETYEVVFANANFNGKAITAPCGVSCFRLLGHNAPCRCCGLDMVKDLPEGCDYTFQTNENDGGLWRSYTITPVEWRGSRPVYLVSARDITEEKLREQEYIEAATFDTALNIPNIGRLTSRLDTLLKTGKNGSLFVIDIDNFKLINNAYGYDYSDALLEEITYFLKSVIPPSYVYRYSTSKFAVLYENAD
ncbi:MAG: PocR ligand-binding domain-containing protein, partial [Oscillospiraceae bacterium]|nr:PocR ligand-binding domain-containing protein [Oscillospiraceae bacterium]